MTETEPMAWADYHLVSDPDPTREMMIAAESRNSGHHPVDTKVRFTRHSCQDDGAVRVLLSWGKRKLRYFSVGPEDVRAVARVFAAAAGTHLADERCPWEGKPPRGKTCGCP